MPQSARYGMNFLENTKKKKKKKSTKKRFTVISLSSVVLFYTRHRLNLMISTGAKSAFTAWNPTSAPRSGYIKFSSIQSNIGNDFNTSSGHFTCRYPGVYVFYLHLYRASTTSYSGCYCYIRKNGSNFVEAYNDPYSSYRNGYHETSNSITFRLRRGDTVSVGGCSTINDKYTYTSFTGFLVKAE